MKLVISLSFISNKKNTSGSADFLHQKSTSKISNTEFSEFLLELSGSGSSKMYRSSGSGAQLYYCLCHNTNSQIWFGYTFFPTRHVSPQIEITPELPEKLKPEEPYEPPPPLPEKKRLGRQQEERVPLPVVPPPDARPRFTRQISTASQRGNRIIRLPQAPVSSGYRRQIGKGLVGRWLNRTIKRKRLTSSIKEQMDSLEDHRLVS